MCYSTTKGSTKRQMAFPGVVKPSPWPGLQPNHPQFVHPPMSGALWQHNQSSLHGDGTRNHRGEINNNIHSATTHFKLLPPSHPACYDFSVVNGEVSHLKDKSVVTSQSAKPISLQRQPSSFPFDESISKPVFVSTERSFPPSLSSPTPASDCGGVMRSLSNEEGVNGDPAVVLGNHTPNGSVSPANLTKKKRVRRKRCGSCTGCTRGESCGSCSVCTNANATNSVCKLKRCEALKRRVSDVATVGHNYKL